MAKRRAAFLLKLERKAEEARLRKQQQEADNELKRDEARSLLSAIFVVFFFLGVCTDVTFIGP